MNFKEILNQFKTVHLLAISFILIFNLIYFYPQFEEKRVNAGDAISSTAWSKQVQDYNDITGERSLWNSSMFSGMPWGLLSSGYDYNFARFLNKVSHVFFSYPAGYMIKACLLTYLALILLRVSPYLSVFLALAFSYNVNYIGLIDAGHANKLEVLAGFPLIISGVILGYRGQLLKSFLAIGLSVSIAILRNHPQMVFYLLMLLFVFGMVYFIFSIINNYILQFLKVSLVIVLAFVIGAASNFTQIMSSKDMSDGTMRGKPILTVKDTQNTTKSSSNVEGLDWDYGMGWSFSGEDIFSILIPRAVGGSSKEEVGKAKRGENSLANALKSDPRFKPKKDGNYVFSTYFGGMGFTGGPAYIGAGIIFLFIFSLYSLNWKNRLAFGMTVLALLILSMGKNFEIVNRFLFEYLPFFNKFRAPSSIINVLPAFLVIAIGVGIDTFLKSEKKIEYLKPLYTSIGITAGLCVMYYLYAIDGNAINEGQELIVDARKSLLKADVIRTLFIIGIAGLILFLYLKDKIKAPQLIIGLSIVVLVDLVSIGKRYLDEESYVKISKYENEFTPRPVDQQILSIEKKGRPYYRVFDQSISTFNSAHTSYHHNTIGGYHAAKLQRYQDLIDYQISKGNMEVLNMLNTKYFINQNQQMQINDKANGVAWFVKNLVGVNTPLEEIKGLDSLNTKSEAVVLATEFNKEDYNDVGDGNGVIELDNYLPNKLVYSVKNKSNQFAVFSEIWYGKNDSWKAYIDGKEANIVRVNYVLRGLEIPANSKQIEFVFNPPLKYAYVSGFFSSVLLILLFLAFVLPKKYRDKLNFVSK